MRILLLTAGALALSVGTTSLAQGNGNGNGNGNRGGGGGKPERVQQGGGHGGGHGGAARAERPNRSGGEQRAERGNGGGNGKVRQAERRSPEREMRSPGRSRDVAERGGDDRPRGNGHERVEERGRERLAQPGRGAERRAVRLTQRRAAQVADTSNIARLSGGRDTGSMRGCPPGLAKKYNGCMPPGQVRQQALAQNWYGNLWAQLIQQVAALVTGDEWNLGQQMPDGYGVYNVPSEYRDQYQDSQDAMYRYSDGYVYQVDPTTQLIQAAIQLIT
jgi:hypothetical protein